MKKVLLLVLFSLTIIGTYAQKKKRRDHLITLETNLGVSHIILFDETPLHKKNFLNLVKTHFYDGLLFHRVIENFMIQGGDPESKNAESGKKLGSGGSEMEKIPYEFTNKRVHINGALAAARDGNRKKMSSACQFYIVQGKKLSLDEIAKVEAKNEIKYTEEQKNAYVTKGGTPFLDNNYTVFGTILDNQSLIREISMSPKDGSDRPEKDITMKMTVKKMSKRKISKKFDYKYD